MFFTVVYMCLGIAVTSCDESAAVKVARSIEPDQTPEECHVRGLNFVDLARGVMDAQENRDYVFRITCERLEG